MDIKRARVHIPAAVELTHRMRFVMGIDSDRLITAKQKLTARRDYEAFTREHTCASCKVYTLDIMECCSRCKIIHYCKEACQRKDWPAHKRDCGRLCALCEYPLHCGVCEIDKDTVDVVRDLDALSCGHKAHATCVKQRSSRSTTSTCCWYCKAQ